ncbi:MAG: nucleotide sugar dehydrogenase [Candidatus Thorarchaeota archaeon]
MADKTISIVGLGYVGLPVALKFSEAGFQVTGIDIDERKVQLINKGRSPIEGNEPGLNELLGEIIKTGRLLATTEYSSIDDADYVLIIVETPFSLRSKEPLYTSLKSATQSVAAHLRKDTLVIIESTIAPGTINTIVQPILEGVSGLKAGTDFYLATAPERVMPGKLLHNLVTLDRVVGGIDRESTERAVELYKHIVRGELYPTDALTAEVVKTTENAYRDVQIAFANEIALLCENLGVDVFEVRNLVNRSPFRDMHIPGAGVGGHCLPKDSWLLAFGAKGKYEPRLLAIAREINDGMPHHMSILCESALRESGTRIYGSKIAILGLAYLENSDDTRNSPTFMLVKALEVIGAQPIVHDPFVRSVDDIELSSDIDEVLKDSDCVIVMTGHDEYKSLDLDKMTQLMKTHIIVDGRNIFDKQLCIEKGFIYRGVGR